MDNQELIKLDITLALRRFKKSSGIHAKAIGWYTKSNFYHVEDGLLVVNGYLVIVMKVE